MGKSEAAIAFANDHLAEFSFIWTLDCSKDLDLEYQALGQRLSQEFQELRDLPPNQIPQRVRGFLNSNHFTKPWLLIYDNVDQTLLEKDLPERGGCVLMTARQENVWCRDRERIAIEPFSPKEAIDLLRKVTGEEESQELKDLAKELDFFPFAINQVGHYIKNTPGSNISKYRKIYDLEHAALDAPTEGDGRYTHILKTVWKTTFDRLHEILPETIEWLKLCSFLHPNDIPLSWLEEWTKDPKMSERVSKSLLNYALMRFNRQDQNLSMHRLMQDVVQAYDLAQGDQQTAFTEAFYFLKEMGEGSGGKQSEKLGHLWPLHFSHLFDHRHQKLIDQISAQDRIQTLTRLVKHLLQRRFSRFQTHGLFWSSRITHQPANSRSKK